MKNYPMGTPVLGGVVTAGESMDREEGIEFRVNFTQKQLNHMEDLVQTMAEYARHSKGCCESPCTCGFSRYESEITKFI